MNWLTDMVYQVTEALLGAPPDDMDGTLFSGDLLGAIEAMWRTPQDLLAFVLYWLFVGLLIVGLFALFRWIFTFTFRLFRLD